MSLFIEVINRLADSLARIFSVGNVGFWILIMLTMVAVGWSYKKLFIDWKQKKWEDEVE